MLSNAAPMNYSYLASFCLSAYVKSAAILGAECHYTHTHGCLQIAETLTELVIRGICDLYTIVNILVRDLF